MKRCPTCNKTFDDKMRFCQTDGTPLVEVKEDAAPPDPYATMVANKDDIASVISSSKESSSAPPQQQEDDLLDISGSDDFMKTSVVSEAELREMSIGRDAAENSSSSPFPAESTSGKKSESSDFSSPPPPRFSEPDLNPPSFGDSPFSSPKTPPLSDSEKSAPPKFDSPFSSEPPKRNLGSDPNSSSPIPSPFGEKMPPSYQTPSNPPFAPPEFREEEIKAEALNTPFAEEVSRENQQMAQNEWAPPASPSSGFGDQANAGNPPSAAAGQSKMLAIISLVLGALGFICCGNVLCGIPAIIVGFIARNKEAADPRAYAGSNLAMIGIVLGILSVITFIGLIIFQVFVGSLPFLTR